MINEILITFCLCDDLLKSLDHQEDPQNQMSDSEVITTVLTAARFFQGNIERSRIYLKEHGLIPKMLSKSRLNRRIHKLPTWIWLGLIQFLACLRRSANEDNEYVVDSYPLPVCRLVRAQRLKILEGKEHMGYCAAQDQYFFGFKVHVIITATGQPVTFRIGPGSEHDMKAFKQMDLCLLEEGASIFGDKAYNDYGYEDQLKAQGILLKPKRKCNSKRGPALEWLINAPRVRKYIETVFSSITSWMPRKLHAVTKPGLIVKISSFIAAFSVHSAFC